MGNKMDFFKHPLSGFAIILVVAVGLLFAVNPSGNSLKALDPDDYFVINMQENIESMSEVDELIEVMDAANVAKTVLVGSPEELLNYQGEEGFSNIDENNAQILKIAKRYDERFYAFCSMDPEDPNKLDKFQECVRDGADGLKLYTGHSFFYDNSLDDESMMGVYGYLEENDVPVIFHVNTSNYLAEFENVLTLYPDMTVVCPHWCLSSKNPGQLSQLLAEYPNLYVGTSFGYKEYLHDGLIRISENVDIFKELFAAYSGRFLYGTTAVVTSYSEEKDEDWLTKTYETYRDLFEQSSYTTFHVTDAETGEELVLNGLGLDDETLKKIYYENWELIMGE